MGRKIFYWGLFAIYSIIVFIFSSRSETGVKQFFYGQDKVIHFIIYAFHAFLGWIALLENNLTIKWYPYLLSFIFSFSFSLFNEIYQYFIPEREFSLGDIIANLLGIITCLAFISRHKVKKVPGTKFYFRSIL